MSPRLSQAATCVSAAAAATATAALTAAAASPSAPQRRRQRLTALTVLSTNATLTERPLPPIPLRQGSFRFPSAGLGAGSRPLEAVVAARPFLEAPLGVVSLCPRVRATTGAPPPSQRRQQAYVMAGTFFCCCLWHGLRDRPGLMRSFRQCGVLHERPRPNLSSSH